MSGSQSAAEQIHYSVVARLNFPAEKKMFEKYALAILRWRQYAGPADTWSSAAVSTILFGCQRWMETNGLTSDKATREQILAIKHELDAWVDRRTTDAGVPQV